MYVNHSVSYLASVCLSMLCQKAVCMLVMELLLVCLWVCECACAGVLYMWVCLLCLSAVFLSIPLFLFSDGYQYKGTGWYGPHPIIIGCNTCMVFHSYIRTSLSFSLLFSPSLALQCILLLITWNQLSCLFKTQNLQELGPRNLFLKNFPGNSYD